MNYRQGNLFESDYLKVVYLHQKLFGGTVPPPKKLFGGTVPPSKNVIWRYCSGVDPGILGGMG